MGRREAPIRRARGAAVYKVQQWYRRILAILVLRDMKRVYALREKACTTIQASFRRHRCEVRYRVLRKIQQVEVAKARALKKQKTREDKYVEESFILFSV